MTLKLDGTRPDLESTLRVSADVLNGHADAAWALLEETGDDGSSGWSVFGLGDYSDQRLPVFDDGEDVATVTFSEAREALPAVPDLLDWGNGEFPPLMEAWLHQGRWKWMPWEDFTKYADESATS
jgi:hypothetical protein